MADEGLELMALGANSYDQGSFNLIMWRAYSLKSKTPTDVYVDEQGRTLVWGCKIK